MPTKKNDDANTPMVSVCIPVYNGEDTIRPAIDSLFKQDHPNIEIVVVDDCSTDATAEILRSYGDKIRPFFHEKNLGTAGAYNRGTREAHGEFVVLMASDCCMTDPGYISGALTHMSDESVAGVAGQGVFTNVRQLGHVQRIFTAVNLLDVTENNEEEVFEVSFIETRCDLVRKKALEDIGFWFEGLYNSTEDQDVSARMRQNGYRLIQDKRLKFSLDFGAREDTLYKVLRKQYEYANGQAYIFLKYGLGHHTMTGKQDNRRSRILHRFVQILMGPIVLGLITATAFGSYFTYVFAAAVVARAVWYWFNSRRWLSALERVYCALIGPACDIVYSTGFLTNLVLWAIHDPGIVRFGRPVLKDG